MSANWWEIGKPVQDIGTVSAKGSIAESDTEDKAKQNWWEIGRPVEEPAQTEAAPVRPAPTTPGQGAGMSFQDLFGGPITPQTAEVYKTATRLPGNTLILGGKEVVNAVKDPKTYQNLGEQILEGIKQTGEGLSLSQIDSIPDSTMIPMPSIGVETPSDAMAYWKSFGINSDAELKAFKQSKQAELIENIQSSKKKVQELTPEGLSLTQRGLRGGIESVAIMAPGAVASAATRSPIPVLTAAGTLEGFSGYGEARTEGKSPASALAYGGINSAIEVLTEVAPTGKLLSAFGVKDKSELKDRLLSFAVAEMGTEQAATALQTLNAVAFGLDEELANANSVGEIARIQAERQALTAISTIVSGGTQAGAIGLVNRAQEQLIRRNIEAETRDIEGIGSAMEIERIMKIRSKALDDAQAIAPPSIEQIGLLQGQQPNDIQYGTTYAQRIFDSVGNYVPENAEFKIDEKDTDVGKRYIVVDQKGRQFGQSLVNQSQAIALSDSLNNIVKERSTVLESIKPIQESLQERLKGFGLDDIGLSIDRRVFNREGEALTSEGLFDPVVRRVFLAVDAIDPDGTLTTDQRREALRGVLRHEVVHALRYLDLWKKTEWNNLEKAASTVIKPGTGKTYLQIAQDNYSDATDVIKVEESVADLIRDVADRQSNIAGRPRTLSERAINFFDKAKNAVTGSGFQTYEDIVQRFEQGDIGARERGRIRTYRATEERLSKIGKTPERVQRLFTTPQDRNQFRQETVQKVQQETPAVAVPAINSLRLNAVRESRSTIDPVAPMIAVDDREVPTRDSEGRLIYSGFEGPEVFNTPTRPTMDGLRNFWNWFGSSKAVNSRKRPLVYYHGTAADITAFQPKQAGSVFLTRSPRFAEEFSALSENYMVENFTDFMSDEQVIDALNETLQRSSAFTPSLYDRMAEARDKAVAEVSAGKAIRPYLLEIFKEVAVGGRSSRYLDAIQKRLPSGANLMPVYVRAEKPWDYDNKDDIKAVVKRARDNGADITASMVEEIGQGNWQTIEGSDGNAPILDAIRELGYDSMFVEEGGQKNLAVFDPGQIKSAIGNNGDFSPLTPSIRESRISSPGVFEQADIGINVRSDQKSGLRYADEIVDGNKKYETRDSDSLRPYVGKRIAIVRTGEGAAKAIGEVTVGEPILVDETQFNEMRSEHLVPAGSTFDIKPGSKKYLYPMLDPVRFDEEKDVGAGIVARKVIDRSASIRESRKFPAKSTPEDAAMAQEYLNRTGELPYLSEGQLEPIVPVARQSIKKPYEAKDLAKGKENDPILGLPLNKNGTVTLYYPATNEAARRTIQDKRLKGSTPTSNRIYLTNESSGPKVMQNPGNIDQPMDGANVLIQVDPSLLHIDQEYEDGRKDFFIQLAEGDSYANKMKQTKLFTLDAPRTRALSKDTKLVDIERSVSNSIGQYLSLDAKGKRARLKQARDVLKKEHNVGTLMGENGKLQKTRLGDYGLTYEGKSVASMGLGLASAQRINEQNLSTCPKSAICEGLCLGETSGQNRLYGGEGQFKSGPRLSQYLKTEALVQHPEDFSIVLFEEISRFQKWANSEKGVEQVENESGETVTQSKQVYQPAIRLNVTSDFRPQTFASIINAFPDVMFYDYTKLPTRSIAPNHHLTYSSTGASQIVNGEIIVNPESNWDRMVQQLNNGMNVAMAFTSRTDMPDFVVDERTGQRFQVWNGDNYDARFLDPKREDGIGMIVGLTNKDSTTKPEEAAKKNRGFFLDYDRARDGDALVIPNQGRLRIGAAPQGPVAEAARPPAAREARRRGTPIGPTQPGPTNDTDSTSAAEALNGGQPVNSVGTPTGPQIGSTMPDGTVDISEAKLAPLMQRLIIQMIQGAPEKLRAGIGLDDLANRIENYYDGFAAKLGMVNGVIFDAFKQIERVDDINPIQKVIVARENKKAALDTFERFIRARENGRTDDAQSILNMATDSERQLIDAWNEIARQTGEINTSIRTPDGKPMRVWDAKRNEWRPIRSVLNFFPRTFRKEVMAVMKNPDLDPALWQELLEAIVQSGKAGNQAEARDYLLRKWFSNEVKQDYFSGVEKARNEALPEIFYDYSWDAATRYLRKWARRTSQIENFGQTIGTSQKEWFDKNIPSVMDEKTQQYLDDIRNIIYETGKFDVLSNLMNWGSSFATGLFLGNPVSSGINLIGGTTTSAQEFGIKEIFKAYYELMKDWSNVQKEGTTLGVLNKDILNILNDHVEADVDKYFGGTAKEKITIPKTKYTPEIKTGIVIPQATEVSKAFANFANVMLNFGGYNSAENVVRAATMLAARARLTSWLAAVNESRESPTAKNFFSWVEREKLDAEALIIENGAGPETERYMRRAVNVPQGSYNIDMTPIFSNTQFGRFFFKFQKFGTQVNRFAYNHFLKPFWDNPNPKTMMNMFSFIGIGILGGAAVAAFRDALGYGDPGPDYDEIEEALKDRKLVDALSILWTRAVQNLIASGILGFFGNYAQMAKDFQDQERVKNPFEPPGIASINAFVELFKRSIDQGRLTARDLDEIVENSFSFYRANKRIGLAAMDAIGIDFREVRRFAAQKEIREVQEYGRRYSEAMDIEFKRRTAPGAFAATPMTPVNKAIADALQQGDAARARLLVREAVSGLRGEERDRVEASIRSSARNRQPIQIGGSAPSQDERMRFLRWARTNLPAEKYQMILRSDRNYRRTANRANIRIGD